MDKYVKQCRKREKGNIKTRYPHSKELLTVSMLYKIGNLEKYPQIHNYNNNKRRKYNVVCY